MESSVAKKRKNTEAFFVCASSDSVMVWEGCWLCDDELARWRSSGKLVDDEAASEYDPESLDAAGLAHDLSVYRERLERMRTTLATLGFWSQSGSGAYQSQECRYLETV